MNQAKDVNEMRKAGNAAMEVDDYGKAIRIYSEALLLLNKKHKVNVYEKGVLHSNRSYAYLKSAMKNNEHSETQLQLAMKDADEVIKIRPNWWKGYFRAGEVHKYRKEWDLAVDRFNEALSLNGELVGVKKCRDECRFEKIHADMSDNMMSHGFKDEIDKVNEMRGTKLDAEHIVKHYQELLASENRKRRAEGCVFFGVRYVKGVDVPQDLNKGISLLNEAVDADSPEAMVELGVLYMQGTGVERNIKKAVDLFNRAASISPKNENRMGGESDGTTHAQFHIGLCFENGTGKPLDYFQARRWYEKASERGHAGAANNLAVLYIKGLGGEKCSMRAKQFFKLSASRGNTAAMHSLAWTCLDDKELEQAESWYARALDSGNECAFRNKEKFYQAKERLRKYLKDMDDESKKHNPKDVENLIEALERATDNQLSISKFTSLTDSPVEKYWRHVEEIQKRAKIGHPFAKRLLTSMTYFAESVKHLERIKSTKMNAVDLAIAQEQCIQNLANSLRETEIVAFLQPKELQLLIKICEAKTSSRKSDLDKAARIVQTFLLSNSQNSEFFSFTRICLQQYPDEVFFYRMHSAALALQNNFEASAKVSDQGLQKFPTDVSLLSCKAGAIKLVESSGNEQVIAAYKMFLKHAPFDERGIPEAYYFIALYSSEDEKDFYYQKGLEAEQQMLPCFLPYECKVKTMLDALSAFKKNSNKGQSRASAESSTKSTAKSSRILQVTNPARVQSVLRHRETLKKISESHRPNMCHANFSITPQHEQKMSEHPDDFKGITLRDMNPLKDMVYQKRLINLVISEDPMFGLLSAIHVVVRDDNDDCINCSFYGLDHFDRNVRANLAFGSKITVLNPYYRLATDGSVALRVDDPKAIIYRVAGKDNSVCRYCWKENPQHSCGSCKRVKYCSRKCQTDDWKIMKHKIICGLKYFDGM
ncbi:hypothetical protein HA402_003854 [Bradysia odoriphaga]|nr:hypothetical protein HA402_003854 [Bradysia odoriphaga]